jgi:hypothetical protein
MKLRTVQDMTYQDDDDAIMDDVPDVPNAIIDVVANCDVPVANGDEAEQENGE